MCRRVLCGKKELVLCSITILYAQVVVELLLLLHSSVNVNDEDYCHRGDVTPE